MARYYDRRGEYGAARFYYQNIVDQYADTAFSEETRNRLAEIQGEPEVPPQRLQWLVDVFPEQEDVRPLIATSPTGTTRH
jgi:hypothetical protein